MSLFTRFFGEPKPVRSRQEYLIKLDGALRRVYLLTEELRADPKQVELTRTLTLDKSRPNMGLKGRHGLFASDEWWNSINTGRMPLRRLSGTAVRVYEAGQDRTGIVNTLDLEVDGGTRTAAGIYVNNRSDTRLFKVGCKVELVYALDELKKDHGSGPYAEIALEMAVSAD